MSALITIWQSGGLISYPMAVLAMVLFYACGQRYHLLHQDWQTWIWRRMGQFPRENLEIHFAQMQLEISLQLDQYQTIIKSAVTCAPLLGLLGTVMGMIETFASLEDQALYAPQGGIAGGIAQALVTTQMGLIIALLGLFLGKMLQGQQQKIMRYLAQRKGEGHALTH